MWSIMLLAALVALVYPAAIFFQREPLSKFGNVPVYYINLDRSPDRRLWMESLFSSAKKLIRIPAVDAQGEQFGAEFGQDFEGNNTLRDSWCKEQNGSCGEVALSTSHYKAIKTALKDGAEVALILEDDASPLIYFWTTDVEDVIRQADGQHPDWKILRVQFTMGGEYSAIRDAWLKQPSGLYIQHKLNYYGTVAYLIRRSAMEHVVKTMTKAGTDTFDCTAQRSCQSDMWLYRIFSADQVIIRVPPLVSVRMYEGTTGVRSDYEFSHHQKVHEQSLLDSLRLCAENYEYWSSGRSKDASLIGGMVSEELLKTVGVKSRWVVEAIS